MCEEKTKGICKDHYTQKCEVSIIQLVNHIGEKFKVTKRVPNLSTAETKEFRSKKEAIEQFEEWLK